MTVKPMKEYFRKPYLVEDKSESENQEHSDYRYMMDTDWQGLQDSSYIVVQSVRKKPYQTDDYQDMEQTADGFTGIDWRRWKWQGLTPIPPERPDETVTSPLVWVQCDTSLGVSSNYEVIVKNSASSRNGATNFYPTYFDLEGVSGDARGVSLWNVRGGMMTTRATLTTSSGARGTYYVYAKSGGYTIRKTIEVSSAAYYLYAWDQSNTKCFIVVNEELVPSGAILPNTGQTWGYAEAASYNIVFNYGVVTTRTETLTWASDGSQSVSIYRYNAVWDEESESWVGTSLIDLTLQYKDKEKVYTTTTTIGGTEMFAFPVSGTTYGIQFRAVLLH